LTRSREGGRMRTVSDSAETERALRAAGLRVTRPRVAVLDAVREQPHLTTKALISEARTRLDAVSHQAVYDVLNALVEAGLVRRIQPEGSDARYEARVGDNHHHVVCRDCGAIADVDCATAAAPCLIPATDTGFVIDEAEVVFWGRCPSCTGGQHPAAWFRSTAQRGTS
jgi:Fur family transcriptional regulator, stress-responsive regulator